MNLEKMNGLSVYDNKTLGRYHCWYCGDWLFEGIKTKDHFWPRNRGGRLMVRCCKKCNRLKSHMTPAAFIVFIQELKAENPAKQNLFARFDRMIRATETLWDRVKWSVNNDKKTIYEQSITKSRNTSGEF